MKREGRGELPSLSDRVADPRIVRAIEEAEGRRAHASLAAARYAVVAEWMHHLGISHRQRIVLGRVYSFSKNGDPFRMSLARAGGELGIDRDNLKHDLARLVEYGYLEKRSDGVRTPAAYYVDETACYDAALANGWVPRR